MIPVPKLGCDRCGSTGFDEVWECTGPNRSTCPFQRYNTSQSRYAAGLLVALFGSIFLFSGIFFAIFMARQGVTWYSFFVLLVFLAVFLAFGGFALLLGAYFAFGFERSLYLPQSETAWQGSQILGFILARRVVQRLSTESAPSRLKLKYPTSIAALVETSSWKDIKEQIRNLRSKPAEEQKRELKSATVSSVPRDLVLSVILDLVSRGLLTASRVRTWTAKFRSTRYKEGEEIVLSPGPEFNSDPRPAGAVEQKIIEIVMTWRTRPESASQPLGPTGKLLVRELLGSNSAFPGNNLIQLAVKQAVTDGIATQTSRWFHSFRFAETVKESQREDHATLMSWMRQFESADYVKRLAEDIQAGIKSRETSD